jgi:hypothetical protein
MNNRSPHPFVYWYVALLLLISVYLFIEPDFRLPNLLLACPVALACIFFASIAQVKLEGDHLRYRRFIHCKVIGYSDVRDCHENSMLGSLKADRYLPLWGRLYFTRRQVGWGWDKKIIESIRRKAGLDPG